MFGMSGKLRKGVDDDDRRLPRGVFPSAFMRKLRPEIFSDTQQRASYVLNAATLEYHLDSITSRNQTHDFEIFCRKLCERTVCPNLRPQTGPEGGGDSKADTETYPVADEILSLIYVGNANSGREKWAFAFSAKKRWSAKVRSDAKGIVETERSYDRIIFVTSQFTRAKDRARIEDELTKKYGLPITIHDRSWIVKEIIENDRAYLAYNYLKVGEAVTDPLRLGPKDYSRSQQLTDVERSIEDPEAFRGMELQRVTEALVAAKLSRGLERPRIETDGRFTRAIRLAEAHGTFRQKLEARYEQIWTAFWWFNDFEFVNSSYGEFESRALTSDSAENLEFLGNLHQLLVNSVIHNHMTLDECRLVERTEKLKRALETIAQDPDRPNNSLAAQTAFLRIRLNQAIMAHDREALSVIWQDFAAIIEKASGLGEYDADSLARFIEVAGEVAGNDPAYTCLVEKLADFVGSRKSGGEAARILLNRAQNLDFSDRFDIIRLLGKAAIGLTKREYVEQLIEALQLLALAYRSAGLLWASRASCTMAIASIIIESERDSELPVSILPTLKLWAWIALELSHLPDLLNAIQWINGCLSDLPLTEESKTKVREDVQELDAALGCLILNLDELELGKLDGLPDILEALGLFVARTTLLYALGYADILRKDGSLPKEETDESVRHFLSVLKSQPAAESFRGSLILNGEGCQTFETTILGMKIEVEIDKSESILIAECILGSLEAFFATLIEQRVAPHTEVFRIVVTQCEEVQEPVIKTNELDMTSNVMWPRGLSVTRLDKQRDAQDFLSILAGHVIGTTCVLKDSKALLENLFADEAVQQRMTMIAIAPNSYSRATSRYFSRLSDWEKAVRRSYPILDQRPEISRITIDQKDNKSGESAEVRDGSFEIKNHRGMTVRSVIDMHAWDKAAWKGCGYLQIGYSQPPYMALLFENAEPARKIFERWRVRFGEEDANNEIAISIIRELPAANPHHYCVQFASKDPTSDENVLKQPILMVTRSMIMEPDNSQNLNRFLTENERLGAYYLVPAALSVSGKTEPEFFFDLAIMKRDLTVKSAAEVGEHDIESLALRIHCPEFAL